MACPICISDIEDCFVTVCGHSFCRSCIAQWTHRKKQCPLCRAKIKGVSLPPGPRPIRQRYWNARSIKRYRPYMTKDMKDVVDFLFRYFPTVPFYIVEQNTAKLSNLAEREVRVKIMGQRDWVPAYWVAQNENAQRPELSRLLNCGPYGVIPFLGRGPPSILEQELLILHSVLRMWSA